MSGDVRGQSGDTWSNQEAHGGFKSNQSINQGLRIKDRMKLLVEFNPTIKEGSEETHFTRIGDMDYPISQAIYTHSPPHLGAVRF